MQNSISDLSAAAAPLSLTGLLLNLAIGTVLSVVLRWHYIKYGRALANRANLARIFPFITLTTLLVITVVKSSLALSLGLVGALSIVRFRTPIKEPEELAYLFLAIAIGLGLGANQVWGTLIAVPFVMVIVALLSISGRERREENLFLNVVVPTNGNGSEWFNRVNETLSRHVELADMRRADVADGEVQLTYFIRCDRNENLVSAMDDLQSRFPGASISFVEQQNYLGG